MLLTPLHAAVVHFPLVFVVLLPISIALALYAIRRGVRPMRAWAIPVALAGALTVSAFVALRTGAADEERVEGVVAEQVIHAHEEAAERFMMLSGVMLAVALVGLARGLIGRSARLVSTAGALGLVVLGIQVGHAGGQLVYRHGAAAAYAEGARAAVENNREGTEAAESNEADDSD